MGTSFLTALFGALRPSIPAGDNPFSPSAENQPFAVSFERKGFIFTHMHKNTMYLYHDNKDQLILLTACFEGSLMGLMGRQPLNTDENPGLYILCQTIYRHFRVRNQMHNSILSFTMQMQFLCVHKLPTIHTLHNDVN